jgi:hypothetical protein
MIRLANLLKEITVNKPRILFYCLKLGLGDRIHSYKLLKDNDNYWAEVLYDPKEGMYGDLLPNGDFETNLEKGNFSDFLKLINVEYYIHDNNVTIPSKYISKPPVNEITVNKPNIKLFDATVFDIEENIDDLDDAMISYFIESNNQKLFPLSGYQYKASRENKDEYIRINSFYEEKPNLESLQDSYDKQQHIDKDVFNSILKYLDQFKVPYSKTEEISQIEIPAKYFNIIEKQ